MPQISYDRFEGGLDLRKGASVSDANRLRVLTNAYITNGKAIKKRPGIRKLATLEPGTVGLRAGNGVLNTFYAQGTITHADSTFLANKIAHPTIAQDATKIHYCDTFLGFLYVSAEYTNGDIKHHYIDGAATPIADANCPNTREVIKAANKIFAVSGDVVKFSATGAPRDWTTASDAGFLPTGQHQGGSGTATALGEFQKQLVVYFPDAAQVWNVDEDPALMSLDQKIFGVGTRYPRTPTSFASDNFFLSDAGFRSITVNAQTDNKQDADVGSPIDTLVRPIGSDPIAIYASGLGQFWCFDGAKAWVYTFSRLSKISAWSKYTLPLTWQDVTQLDNVLYLRSGDDVYEVTDEVFADDGIAFEVDAEMPYVDAKEPGILKQFWGMDSVVTGTPNISLRYDPRDTSLITEEWTMTKDTRPGEMTPIELCAVSIAPRFRHQANEDFQVDLASFHYHSLGPV